MEYLEYHTRGWGSVGLILPSLRYHFLAGFVNFRSFYILWKILRRLSATKTPYRVCKFYWWVESQILESFLNIWSQVSQRNQKKPFSDFPARGPGMYTLSWRIHEVAVAIRWPGKLKSMIRLSSSNVIYPLRALSCGITQADHHLLVGAVADWNLSNDLLLFIEEIYMNNTVAIICSKMQNLKQIFRLTFKENVNWATCHVFSPCRAVLSAILQDEYLTSAVRTKEGDSPAPQSFFNILTLLPIQ